MNWTKVIITAVVGGIVLWLAGFIMHGVIMADTYTKYPDVFSQEENPVDIAWFLVLAILIALVAVILFAKTRDSWGDGAAAGAKYGFLLGLFSFVPQFYSSLIYEGFPYFLSWCWGGITLIEMVILGVVIALVYKRG